MNKTIIYITSLILLLISYIDLQANDKRTQLADSVNLILNNKNLPDSVKVIHISELALMDHELEPYGEKALEYAHQGLSIANQLSNEDSKVFVYSVFMQIEKDVSRKMVAQDSCIFLIEHSENALIRSIGWQNLSKVKVHTSQALEYLMLALNEIKDKGYWLQEQSVYYDITHYYHITVSDYPQMIYYADLALQSAIKSNDHYIIAKSWHDIGVAYYINYTQNPEDITLKENSCKAFMKTYEMYQNGTFNKNVRSQQLLYVTTMINLSNLAFIDGNIPGTIDHIKSALDVALQYNTNNDIDYSLKPYIYYNSKMYILQCYLTLGNIFKNNKEYAKAEKRFLEALSFLPENILDDIRNGRYPAHRIYLNLAELYMEMGNYQEAVTYYRTAFDEYRKNYDYQVTAMNQHLETAYENQRKEQEFEQLQEEVSLKKNQKYMIISLIIVLIIVLILLYYFLRYRLIASRQEEKHQTDEIELIKLTKQQAELKAQLKAQESDRLQKELMAGSLLVEYKHEIIENLRQFLANHPDLAQHQKEIENIFSENENEETIGNDLKTDLQDIHPEFYNQLQEKANHKLTPLDLQYCRLIFMKMSSKEMADILHVDPKTIRVTKYRLKQKLNLGKEEDLNSFIMNIV